MGVGQTKAGTRTCRHDGLCSRLVSDRRIIPVKVENALHVTDSIGSAMCESGSSTHRLIIYLGNGFGFTSLIENADWEVKKSESREVSSLRSHILEDFF